MLNEKQIAIMVTKEKFLELYYSGYSDSRIGDEYKCCRKQVSKLRHSLNLPQMNQVVLYENRIKLLVENNYSDIRIAKEIGISKSMVGYIRKRLSIKTNFIERTYANPYDRKRGYIIRNIKSSARIRGIYFDLKFEDLELPKHCPVLGMELNYNTNYQGPNQVTVDRIDNNKGYIKGNVIIISRLANAMKNEASFDQLKLFSKNIEAITNYYENQGALGSITDVFPNIELYDENFSLDS